MTHLSSIIAEVSYILKQIKKNNKNVIFLK